MPENLLGTQSDSPFRPSRGLHGETSTSMPVHAGTFVSSFRQESSAPISHVTGDGDAEERDSGEEFDPPMIALSENGGREILLTYGQTIESLLATAKSDGERWNMSGPLNKYMAFHGVDSDTLIVEVTEQCFNSRAQRYLSTLDSGAISTKANHKGALSKWWDTQIKPRFALPTGVGVPKTLGEALAKAMEDGGLTQNDLCKMSGGITPSGMSQYVKLGVLPLCGQFGRFQALEKALRMPPGTLTELCPSMRAAYSVTSDKILNRSKALSEMCKKPYRLLSKDWPTRLTEEWSHFEHVVTGKLVPFKGFKFGNVWKIDEEGHSPSARKAQQFFESFFGFCIIVEIPLNQLTMALVKRCSLVLKFCEFYRLRQGGTFIEDKTALMVSTDHLTGNHTPTTDGWIRTVMTLVKPITGYLWQIHTYGQAIGTSAESHIYLPRPNVATFGEVEDLDFSGADNFVSANPTQNVSVWREGCQDTHDTLRDWINGKVKRKEIRSVNMVEALVEKITVLDRPLDVLIAAANGMESALPPEPDHTRLSVEEYATAKQALAIQFQDMLIMRLNTAVPLRPKNNRLMTFKGESPNLFQREGDRAWNLQFENWETKNYSERSLPLPKSLWPYIEEFLENHRPYLHGPHTDYFLRPTSLGNTRKEVDISNDPISKSCFRERFIQATSKVFGDGFSVYGMRHICATAWLKEDPDGFLVAAVLLDDTIQTVMENYVHLRKSNLYCHYDCHYERSVERVTTGTAACEPMDSIPEKNLETLVVALENAESRGQSIKEIVAAMKSVLRRMKAKR